MLYFQENYNSTFVIHCNDINFLYGRMAYVCIEDYEKYALERLPAFVRDYYKSGAGEEYSVKWNKEAFKT